MPLAAAFLLLDATGGVIGWNAVAQNDSGYTADELRGLRIGRLIESDSSIAEWLRNAAANERFTAPVWFIAKDGSRRRSKAGIERLRTAAGTAFVVSLTGVAAAQLEATDHNASERQFRILVQGVAEYAIYMLDPHGNVTNWNLGGERIKGYRSDEVVGRSFARFYTEEDRARGLPQHGLAVAEREGRCEDEGWRVRKDGSRFWANCVIDAIRDPSGELIGFAKVTRDLSEKKRAEEALEEARAALLQSQKMEAVGQLTGGIAHDFNNLLTVIVNALDLLARPMPDDARRRRVIDSARRAAERGGNLTQQLLAFARRQPLRPAINDINEIIDGFEAVLRRACGEPIDFELDLARGPFSADIDAGQLETALLNLVVNARDAMPKGGRLSITTRREAIDRARAGLMSDVTPGDYVTVCVADTGEGMTQAVQARAFEPFFTTKEVGKGSGLGLSQVYGFVTQSSGHVAIASRPGSGTSVTLYLPATKLARPGRPPAEPEAEDESSGTRVLVVEDDPEVLDVTVETLRRLGYIVLTAPDGPAALAVLRREANVDILFSDIVMPRGMNGVELARTARRLRPELRVLLVSGYPPPALSRLRESGIDGEFAFLGKPYRGSELAQALRDLQPA